MIRIDELRNERSDCANRMLKYHKIVSKGEAGKPLRPLTDEEMKDFNEAANRYEETGTEIEMLENDDQIVNDPFNGRRDIFGQPGSRNADGKLRKEFRKPDNGKTGRGWREYEKQDPDNLDDGEFRNLTDFAMRVANAARGKFDPRLERFEVRIQGTVGGAEGGFAFPPRFEQDIILAAGDVDPWLMRRTIFQVQRQELHVPRFADEDRSSGDVAGLQLSRTGEGAEIPEDTAVFKLTKLGLTKAAMLVPVANELMLSGLGIDRALRRAMGKAIAARQSADFISGTGSGEPLGIANGSDKVSFTSTSSAGALSLGELSGIMARLDGAGNNSSAAWIAHPSVIPALAGATAAGGHSPLWLPDGRQDFSATLLGKPIFFTDACEQLNAQGDLYSCNLSEYWYAWRGILIDSSPHYKFNQDVTTFRVRLYDDGGPLRDGLRTDRQSYTSANFVDLTVRS